jgi:two-component system invasion response regulator UvrY
MAMRILLVEDHPIFRFGVRELVRKRWPDAECGEAGSMAEAIRLAQEGGWTAAVVDLNLPDADGVEAVSRLMRAAPGVPVLVLSLKAEAAYAQHVLQLGAAGYLTKDRAAEELVAALERIGEGGRYISASLAERLADLVTGRGTRATHEELSSREYRVLLLLAAGKRVSDIADSMHLSPKTVSTYRSRIMEKLALGSNAELARYCLEHGLTDKAL